MTRDEAERLAAAARDGDLGHLMPERERISEAVRFFVANGDDQAAADIAANVWRLWLISGEVAGGRAFLAAALDSAERKPSRARALALCGDGILAFRQGAQDESRTRNEEALEIARAVNDREAESLALVGLSRIAFREGDYARVRALALEARELVADLEPAASVPPLHLLAAGTRLGGDLDDAVRLYEESLELNRRLGDKRMVAVELHNVGNVELHRGDVSKAERCFAEAAELRNPKDPMDVAMTHLNQAALACAHGERERAAELLGQTEKTLADAGMSLDPDDAFEVEWLRSRLRSA